ncbi:MAG: hypothetical protein HGA19_02305 [Oscillochloris sp.]|nr:hypothetical protein [Oscillochloris sp.]
MAKYDEKHNPYSWMPDVLRRFLNLTYDETETGTVAPSQASYASAPSATTRTAWTPSNDPTFKASSMEGYHPAEGAPAVTYTPSVSYVAPSLTASSGPGANPIASAMASIDGAQPVTYLVRGYLRGALPPEGLEAFSKQFCATATDVWNLYSKFIIFETQDIVNVGRNVFDTIMSILPASSQPMAAARRIKVTVANGEGNGSPIAITSAE